MGLFDFAKSIGRKLFDNESDAEENIRAHIEQDNPGVKDLKVAYKDGVVSLSGSTSPWIETNPSWAGDLQARVICSI